jgi:ApaG protein
MIVLDDVSVNVVVRYVQAQSVPSKKRFVFAYTITISNDSDETIQLISRHWRITDAHDQLQEVRGMGVVGEQPTLAPGVSYTYTSGVVIETMTGVMEGSYQMKREDGTSFSCPIPMFALVTPQALH